MPLYFTQWEQFQGGAGHQGYVPGALNAASLSLLWSLETYGAGRSSSEEGPRGVAIVDGDIYATAPTGRRYLVSRFDGDSGELEWQESFTANGWGGISSPSVAKGTVYIHRWGHSGSSGSIEPEDFPALIGLDQASGTQQFETHHAGQWDSGSRPTVIDDQIFAAGGYYGGLDAYGTDGSSNWFHRVNQQYGWIPAADEENVYVYMGEAGGSPGPSVGSLFVIDRETGDRTATIEHPNSDGAFRSNLQNVFLGGQNDAFALTHNDIYNRVSGRTLVRFDLVNETILWEKQGAFSGNGAVANGIVAIPNGDELLILDQATGDTLWSWAGSGLSNNVILTDSHVFVNTDSGVHAIDLATRTSVWSVDIQGSLALDDGLLVITNDTGIYVYRTDGSATSVALPEKSADATVVTALNAEDLGYSNPVYAITEGNTNNAFAINTLAVDGTEVLTVATPAALDFETTPTFDLMLTVSDGDDPSRSQQKRLEVRLTDVAEDPPVIPFWVESSALSTVQSAIGNTAFVFSASEGNAITVPYPDAGLQEVLVTLTGNSGTVSVVDSADVTVSGNGTNSVTIQGSLVSVNAALDGASFKAVNLAGSASLTIDVSDLGDVEVGGPKTDSETINFAVQELARHDFNSDGFSDLLWREPESGLNVMWFIENNVFNGNGAIAGELLPGSQFKIQGTGDINLDGKQDLIWRNFETGATFVWFMDGGQFIGSANIMAQAPQGSEWYIESVTDINRDGKADLLWRNRFGNTTVAWYLDSGDDGDNIQLTGGGVITAPRLEWSIKGTGDFNGDGNPDIVWSRTDTPVRVVWYMDGLDLLPGSGAVLGSNVPVEQRPGLDWEIQAIGDYNGDGNPDLVWRNAGTATTVIWNMNNTDVIDAAVIKPNVALPFEIQLN